MTKNKPVLALSSKAIDPALDALFSTSAGAVKTPPKSRYAELLSRRPTQAPDDEKEEEGEGDDDGESEDASDSESQDSAGDSEEELSEQLSDNSSDDDAEASSGDEESPAEDDGASDASSVDDATEAAEVLERAAAREKSQDEGRKRKRKHRDDDEDLEANYLERLAKDEAPSGKRRKAESKEQTTTEDDVNGATKEDGAEESAEEDASDSDKVPVHESLTGSTAASELEKANRTVFLSNVSIEAITSRKAKKTLLKHLSSVLDKHADPPQKIQSIRFRSTPFSTTSIPKRVAYIKKSVLEATTKSTNAYVVYTTPAAARLAVSQLNGTIVLDRHLRVDSVAHPAPIDHRRCVFVGNLGFVDDETVYNVKIDEEGKEVTEKRKRTKTPMDVEEGLWRVFGQEAGKVESVRVVRDAATRVGKGFAYVQFYDANSVEAAILLNGKKFPPMLARELRVSRCKAPHKTARAIEARRNKAMLSSDRKGKKSKKAETGTYVPKLTAEAQTLAGRASKLLGRFGAEKLVGKPAGKDKKKKKKTDGAKDGEAAAETKKAMKGPEEFVFEGRRASAKDGKPKDLKFKPRNKGKDKAHKKKKKKSSKSGK